MPPKRGWALGAGRGGGAGESQVGTQGLNKRVTLMERSRMFPPAFSQNPF